MLLMIMFVALVEDKPVRSARKQCLVSLSSRTRWEARCNDSGDENTGGLMYNYSQKPGEDDADGFYMIYWRPYDTMLLLRQRFACPIAVQMH